MQHRRPPLPAGGESRELAFDLLTAVVNGRKPLDDSFARHPLTRSLAERDRAFAFHLAMTALRRLGQTDRLIDHCLSHPLPDNAAATRNVLRLGAVQILFLETAIHAAVDTAVGLARQRGPAPFVGLVNAVLRRLGREGKDLMRTQDAPRLNTPEWLWKSWSRSFGEADCRAIAEAHLKEPPLDLTVRDDAEGWASRLGGTVLPWGSVRLTEWAPIDTLPGYAEGAWWVQDGAAALPARLLGDVRGRHVLDLCAAPGGKTAQLALAGARVTAVDSDRLRMARLEQNMRRLNLTVETVVADLSQWRPAAAADAILLDLPCSATGTIRRHPDVQHVKSPGDVRSLVQVQDRLLRRALEMIRPGGLLVACVCSLEAEEGPNRIAALLAEGAPLRRVPVSGCEVAGLDQVVSADGDLRTLPCHLADRGGFDGFYAARLQRL